MNNENQKPVAPGTTKTDPAQALRDLASSLN